MSEESSAKWQLEGKGANGEPWIVPLAGNPFRIGRREDCQLRLSSDSISRYHAQIRLTDTGLWIKDCGSTNGTLVNYRQLMEEQPLKSGDVVHFANMEFRVAQVDDVDENTIMVNPYVERFQELISQKAVTPHFQPILQLEQGNIIGYELLGRVNLEGMPNNIGQLFQVAKQLCREVELSTLLRDMGIAQAVHANIRGFVLFNTVPREMDLGFLEDSLAALRRTAPNLGLAMEIHETTIADIGTMRKLRRLLNQINIRLVYDDFGAGQSRLLELMDVPPDILKFDICLVHNIHLRPKSSLGLIRALVQTAKELGVQTLAEGLESKEEAEACRQIGFDLAQGYYFGRPMPTFLGDGKDSFMIE
jgi:EAL domain-containing protein (putative c-di-GMP-specific phosphodiesterase class I)